MGIYPNKDWTSESWSYLDYHNSCFRSTGPRSVQCYVLTRLRVYLQANFIHGTFPSSRYKLLYRKLSATESFGRKDISDPMMARDEKSPKLLHFILWGRWRTIHSIVVKMFQLEPKWWSNWQTGIKPRSIPLAWLELQWNTMFLNLWSHRPHQITNIDEVNIS